MEVSVSRCPRSDYPVHTAALLHKMVGSNGTMIAIRLVRSKLRKREEHGNSVHPAAEVVQTAQQTATATTTTTTPQATLQLEALTYQGQFLWPPPPQPYLYKNDQVGSRTTTTANLGGSGVAGWTGWFSKISAREDGRRLLVGRSRKRSARRQRKCNGFWENLAIFAPKLNQKGLWSCRSVRLG